MWFWKHFKWRSSNDSTKKVLEDISNEGKRSCDGVGKKEDIEGKEYLKTLDCNDSKCDDVDFFSSKEDDLETICVKFDDSYPMERIEENILNFKRKLKRVYIDIEVIIFIHTITIFQITLKSFLGGVKGTSWC